MSESLANALRSVRSRIARGSSRHLNEQNTKATLIEPILRALGWDTEDVDEVVREFKLKRRDKPVDYGLLALRTPRLFVEAKALGENLEDRRWTNQIMGYAGVAGVEWIVLTDGNEYRIYNTHAPVSVDEKLFRTVRVSDEQPLVGETLELLAKDRMEENRIEVLWRAHFVDRQVRGAVDQLFSGDGDLLLVNYVGQHTKNLSPEEIRASLKRCRVTLDFPVPSDELLRQAPTKSARKAKAKSKSGSKTSLRDLVDAGLLQPPVQLEVHYKGKRLQARIDADGSVVFQGKKYASLSLAGAAARASVLGTSKLPSTNGWTFWKLRNPGGDWAEVASVRSAYEAAGPSSGTAAS